MRVKVVLSGSSYAQTTNLPVEGSDTVAQLKDKLKKRVTGLPDVLDLTFDGGKVFDEDTLESLGIKEGDVFTENAPPAAAPVVPAATLDLTDATQRLNLAATAPPAEPATTTTASSSSSSSSASSSSPLSSSLGTAVVTGLPERLLEEVVEIVFDISSSMDANFVDLLSRLSASKVCFGAFIDKTLAFEYMHAVGLFCFGQNVYETLPVTRDLNKFEAVFGSATKTEGATNLYPAVDAALKALDKYCRTLPNDVKKRIICFTDGGDNSGWAPLTVARTAVAAGVVVDAVIVGGDDSEHVNLRALAHSTGGLSVRIPGHEASLSSVFEREAILALSARNFNRGPAPLETLNGLAGVDTFKKYGDVTLYPYVGVDLKQVATATTPAPAPAPVVVAQAAAASVIAAAPKSGTASGKRILKEYQNMGSSAPDGTETYISGGDNIFEWKILFHGPPNTPYAGGVFVVQATFPPDYPFKPPKMVFLTPVYHCNISDQGRICLSILADQWSPALSVAKIIHGLQGLLTDCNPDDALDAWKASLARTDRNEYTRQATEHTKRNVPKSVDEARKDYNLAA